MALLIACIAPALRGAGRCLARLAVIAVLGAVMVASHSPEAGAQVDMPQVAQLDQSEVSAIKVGFVYNFAKFTVWPNVTFPSAESPVVFCIREGALDKTALAALSGKRVGSRAIEVQVFDGVPPPGPCHLIYLSASTPASEIDWAINFGSTAPTLIISDLPGFAEMGGHIALVLRDGRLQFKINVETAAQGHLELSSRLLQLAEIVGG